tara:strand:- start:315 stop:623 length:309 start_codon:yes stop_codon:yes gene_type:complete
MGVLRYSPSAFWDCTLGEILTAVESFHNLDQSRNRQLWEASRFLAYVLLQPHKKKGSKMKLEDIVQFEWEKARIKKESDVEYSEERIKELVKYAEENSYLSF